MSAPDGVAAVDGGSPMGPAEVWPVLGIRLTTADLLLRPAVGDDVLALGAVVPDDLELDPASARFDVTAGANRRAAIAQGIWRNWGTWTAESWNLAFTVVHDGMVVGSQNLEGERFDVVRTVDTSSWLVSSVRGRGFGRQMRSAVLTLAFNHLGAEAAITAAWRDNHSSLGVSRRLGYTGNGLELHPRLERGETARDEMLHLRITKQEWVARDQLPVTVTGVDGCLPYFGAQNLLGPSN